MALHQFVALLEPFEDQPSLRMLLGAISTQPILDVLVAAGLTWAAHSRVAIILLVMSFAAQGTVPPDAAFALVLGANLGTPINPVLEGATGNDPAARRLPLGNLINRAIGVALALTALPWLGRCMVVFEPNNARAVADFHTVLTRTMSRNNPAVSRPAVAPHGSAPRRPFAPMRRRMTRDASLLER